MTDISPARLGIAADSPARRSPARPKSYNKHLSHYRYSEADVLGEGAYGAVYRAYDVNTRDPVAAATGSFHADLPVALRGCRAVALKQMSNAKVEEGMAAATMREIAVLKELSHLLRSDQRPDAVTRLGGCATFNSGRGNDTESGSATRPGALASDAEGTTLVAHRAEQPRTLDGDGTTVEYGLTDHGDTSEAADDTTGWPSSSSPTSSPSVRTNATAAEERLEAAKAVAQGRQHILELYEVVIEKKTQAVFVVLQLCDGGDAWHYLRNVPERRIHDARVFRRWVRELVLGVAFMHSKRISHRDLKPQNIMLQRRPRADTASTDGRATAEVSEDDEEEEEVGEAYTLMVADFGLSRVEEIPVKKYIHEAVTLWYRSPDVILGNTNYSYSVDAWSVGCIVVEFASGAPPFRGKDEKDQLKRIFLRMGAPRRSELPTLMNYPHSETYAPVLEWMAQYNEHEERKGTFAGKEAYEVEQMRKAEDAAAGGSHSRCVPSATSASSSASLTTVAINRARLREILQTRGAGMDVLGDDGLDFVARLLIVDPAKRMSIVQAVHHPFMQRCLHDEDSIAPRTAVASLSNTGNATPKKSAASTAKTGGVAMAASARAWARAGGKGGPASTERALSGRTGEPSTQRASTQELRSASREYSAAGESQKTVGILPTLRGNGG